MTVLFTDLAGYTSMSEKLDPEEAFGLMEQVYEILIRTVNEYGGTVNELTGDGVMALFGAPIALEDAPQRAIRAGSGHPPGDWCSSTTGYGGKKTGLSSPADAGRDQHRTGGNGDPGQ